MKLKLKRAQIPQLAVALAFALAAGTVAGFVYSRRDFIFEWSWAKTRGTLEDSVPPTLVVAARDYAEAARPGEACVAKSVGRDDRYLYAEIGCGGFSASGGPPRGGDAAMVASRFRYHSGDRVSSWEKPVAGAFENSVHRLFPPEVFQRLRYGVPRALYWAAGAARAKEKAPPRN